MRLSEKAMLSSLKISVWSGRRLDKGLTAEVCAAKQARPDAGRWNKNLVVGTNELEDVRRAATDLRGWYYSQTLPWSNDGLRMLPVANYFEFHKDYAVKLRAFENALVAFKAAYPGILQRAPAALNGMFRADDYPRVGDIGRLFGVSIAFLPVPEAEDFRVKLSDDEAGRIKAEIGANMRDSLSEAMGDLWRRLREAVGHVQEKLSVPGAIFRDSLIGNIRELVDLIPRLNVTGDTDLDVVASEVKAKLAALDPDVLRTSELDRSLAAQSAAEIVAKMSAYVRMEPAR